MTTSTNTGILEIANYHLIPPNGTNPVRSFTTLVEAAKWHQSAHGKTEALRVLPNPVEAAEALSGPHNDYVLLTFPLAVEKTAYRR